jgi:AraC-like DNA-binding protein
MVVTDADLLPGEVNWRDEGCELFPSCLNCPLPRCIEEEPRGKQRLRMLARARRMAELRRDGKSIKQIAVLFGVSKRTVQRALASYKSSRSVMK